MNGFMRRILTIGIIVGLSLTAGYFVFSWIATHQRDEVQTRAYARLQLFLGLRKTALEDHFESSAADVQAMSRNQIIRNAMQDLMSAWIAQGSSPGGGLRKQYVEQNPHSEGERSKLDAVQDDSDYAAAHARLQPWSRRFLEHFGYADLYLISLDGDIIYSAQKSGDFGQNAASGKLAETALGLAFANALRFRGRKGAVSDFELYAPGDHALAAFAANAIADDSGDLIGVLAVQLPAEPVNNILDFNEGLGTSGETYVVGSDGLMRSQSRFENEDTPLKKKVESPSIEQALGGFSGSHLITNYRGTKTLSAYAPLELQGERWALVAERAEDDVYQSFTPHWAQAAGTIAAVITALLLYLILSTLLFRPISARAERRWAMKRAKPSTR